MLDETGCYAIMIGRAALGNPWIFKQVNEYIENNKVIELPTPLERVEMCIKHFKYLEDIKVSKVAVLEIRNHVAWYLKGIKGSNEIKNKIYMTKDIEEIKKILYDYKCEIEEDL